MSKGKIQELYHTSDDDSGILRQAQPDSNSQTTKPTLESKKREEISFVCVSLDAFKRNPPQPRELT
jgi:hypothetical protein